MFEDLLKPKKHEARVLSVAGPALRKIVDGHMDSCQAAIAEYTNAAETDEDPKMRDRWRDDVIDIGKHIAISQMLRPLIADGPHSLTVQEVLDFTDHFPAIRSVAEVRKLYAEQLKSSARRHAGDLPE